MEIKAGSITLALVIITAAIMFFNTGAHGQLGPDAQVITQLKKAGSNLSKPHPIEFFFYFPSREGADRIAIQLTQRGYKTKVDRSKNGPDWLVLATKNMVPYEPELARLRREFTALVASERGEYDGWGTEVIK